MKKNNSFLCVTGWIAIVFLVRLSFSYRASSINEQIFAGLEADTTATTLKQDEPVDSATVKLESLYSNWKNISRSCYILFEQASAHNYTALPEEFNERLVVYKQVFPKITIDSEVVYKELAIEKYLLENFSIAPSPFQIDAVYGDFLEQYPYADHPDRQVFDPILRSKALFSMDTVVSMISELSDSKKSKRQEKIATLNESWPLKEISLHADPQRCLVTGRDTGCLVSVEEFNTFASIKPMRRQIRLDSARSMLLRKLLEERYFINLVKKNNVQFKNDVIQKQENALGRRLLLQNQPHGMHYDEQLFMNTYNKYYLRFFCDKQIKLLGMIGSTDSLYIDSLYRSMVDIESDTSAGKPSRKHAFLNSLPWNILSSEDLPDTLVSSVNSLRSQEYKTCATPFGFFLVRIIENRRRHKLLLEEVRDVLVYLINEDRARSGGKPDSIRALEYYKKHSKTFKTPDTILTQAWLVPPRIDSSAFTMADKKKQQKMIADDTSAFQPVPVISSDLPASVSDILIECRKKTDNKKGLIGPLFSKFGTWYFSVEKVTAGGKSIPFALAKDSILRKFEVKELPFEKIAKTETGSRLLKQEVLTKAYHLSIPKEIDSIPDEEIRKLIENKTINISYENNGKIDKKLLDFARHELFNAVLEKNKKNVTEWLKTVSIDRTLLFTDCSQYVTN